MATGTFNTSGSLGSHWYGDVTGSVNSQNAGANQTSIHVDLTIRADSGFSQNATNSYNVRVNGSVINSGSRNITMSGGSVDLIGGDTTVTHDANGNWSGSVGGGLSSNASVVGSGSGDYGYSVPRLPLAPSINNPSASNIKPTTATISGSVNDNGHGTSTTITYFYKLSTDGSYSNAGTGSSVDLTGLSPAKTYDFYTSAANNNGDTSNSSVESFVTQSVPSFGMIIAALL